jgi:hypothetical protein
LGVDGGRKGQQGAVHKLIQAFLFQIMDDITYQFFRELLEHKPPERRLGHPSKP